MKSHKTESTGKRNLGNIKRKVNCGERASYTSYQKILLSKKLYNENVLCFYDQQFFVYKETKLNKKIGWNIHFWMGKHASVVSFSS